MAQKLDIFKTLEQIDKRNYEFYNSLDDDERKGFQPFVIMRWMSVAQDQNGLHLYYLHVTNQLVNKNLWDLSAHPELVWSQMAACGVGTRKNHKWIKGPSRASRSKIDEVLKRHFPDLNRQELAIMKKEMKVDGFKEFLREYAYDEKEEKDLLKQFKKETK
jgi:hypothetical protein